MNIIKLLNDQIKALEPYDSIPKLKDVKQNLQFAKDFIQIEEIDNANKEAELIDKVDDSHNTTTQPTKDLMGIQVNHNHKKLVQKVYDLANEKEVYIEDVHKMVGLGKQFIPKKIRLIEQNQFSYLYGATISKIKTAIKLLESS